MHERLKGPYRVYVGLVSTGYLNTSSIEKVIREGMEYCGATQKLEQLHKNSNLINPNIVIKPTLPLAHSKIAKYSYTNPELTNSAISRILKATPSARVKIVVDQNLYNIPTKYSLLKATGQSEKFKRKGYFELENIYPSKVKVCPNESTKLVHYQFSKGDSIVNNRETFITSRASHQYQHRYLIETENSIHYAKSDFSVFCPKIKSDVLSHGFSGAIRLSYPGYGPFNDYRICDMLEVCYPNLIISDGITVPFGGNQSTGQALELGVVLVSNNALAHDWVASQILNIDATKIPHLKIAMDRGWGPDKFSNIELGGAGIKGIENLCHKSRHWNSGFVPVQSFAEKFEKASHKTFPLEILVGKPYEISGSHGMLLDWLWMNHDLHFKRKSMAKWPRASVCVGNVKNYPSSYFVYAIGEIAIGALKKITSTEKYWFTILGVEIKSVQLKDRSRHLIICVHGKPPSSWRISLGFFIGSTGRIRAPLIRPSLIFKTLYTKFKNRIAASKEQEEKHPVVLTSHLEHNKWWALRPIKQHTQKIANFVISVL